MRYTTIIFDLDGTLVDTAPGIQASLFEAIQGTLPDRFSPPKNFKEFLGPPIQKVIKRILPQITPQQVTEIEMKFRKIYDSSGWEKSAIYGHVRLTLKEFNGYGMNCFIVTNKPRLPTSLILMKLDIYKYFTEILSPDSRDPSYRSKAEMVEYLINKFSLSKSNILMVGDSCDDAAAARKCNIHFAATAYGYGNVHKSNNYQMSATLFHFKDLKNTVIGELGYEQRIV